MNKLPLGDSSTFQSYPSGGMVHRMGRPVQTLTDAATVAVNAAAGVVFRLATTAARTIGIPTNPLDGQQITIEVSVSGGTNRTMAFQAGNGGWDTSSVAISPTVNGTTDIFKGLYNSVTNKWKLLSQSGAGVSAGSPTFVTVSGTKDGSNVTFTLPNAPTVAGSEQLFKNGQLLNPGAGNDYTISGATITMATAPISTDVLRCYQY